MSMRHLAYTEVQKQRSLASGRVVKRSLRKPSKPDLVVFNTFMSFSPLWTTGGFVVYKLPIHKMEEVGSGLEYMYLDSAVETWQMSKFTVNTSDGAIGLTLNQLYLGQAYSSNSSVYAMYNDAPPDMKYLFGYGHTKDIYAGWVAQELGADLLVETWQRQSHELPSNCSVPYHAMNVERVRLPGSVLFKSRHDHSKWCVSWRTEDQWVCVGDLNREQAQAWRAGGLLCCRNPLIYTALRQAVYRYSSC
ncbi:hypothetical protein CRUP_020721 [Coryphaenoides rupestris]|nr:hypothetical protein CRUP_020721 [Coryphaenoides rupestris]